MSDYLLSEKTDKALSNTPEPTGNAELVEELKTQVNHFGDLLKAVNAELENAGPGLSERLESQKAKLETEHRLFSACLIALTTATEPTELGSLPRDLQDILSMVDFDDPENLWENAAPLHEAIERSLTALTTAPEPQECTTKECGNNAVKGGLCEACSSGGAWHRTEEPQASVSISREHADTAIAAIEAVLVRIPASDFLDRAELKNAMSALQQQERGK